MSRAARDHVHSGLARTQSEEGLARDNSLDLRSIGAFVYISLIFEINLKTSIAHMFGDISLPSLLLDGKVVALESAEILSFNRLHDLRSLVYLPFHECFVMDRLQHVSMLIVKSKNLTASTRLCLCLDILHLWNSTQMLEFCSQIDAA